MRRLLVAVILVLLTCGAPAALAQPTRTHEVTPGTLKIYIAGIAPLAPVETSSLTITGTVTNLGTTPVFAGGVSLTDDSGYAGSRTDLAAFEAAPSTAGTALVSKALPKQLAAGQTAGFTLTIPTLGQVLSKDLVVYELAVVASGAASKGGPAAPLGVAAVPLPYFHETIQAPLRTAVIIPITAVPDQGPTPMFGAAPALPSADLINALGTDGRLGRLLSVVEAAPPSGGTGGTQLTVAIDLALLNRVCALAGLCGQDKAVNTPVSDSAVANQWLKRLFADVELPGVTVVGLPYADADLAAMSAAGDTKAVISLLQEAGTTVAMALPSAATTNLQPLLPVDGLADDTLVSTAKQSGSTVAVLSSTQFTTVIPGINAPVTPTASTLLHTAAGDLPALVTDPVLQTMLSPLATNPASPRLQEQDLLAELAVITSELPNDPTSRTVVLEAPRDWDVTTSFSTGLINALGAVPYVHSEGLETLENAPPVLRGRLARQPRPVSPLPASSISTIDAARPLVMALKLVAAKPKETLSAPFGDGLDRALSAWWRGPGAKTGATLLTSVTNNITAAMNRVSVEGYNKGVLLTGPSGKLPVQVRNDLNEPISIVVHVKNDGLDQVTGRDVSKVLAPGGTTAYQVSVPITTRSTRSVSVTMQLLTKSGGAQIAETTIPVRSTSVGKVAVGITAAALTLLVLLILVRGVRRFAAHRRGEPAATASP